MAKFYGTIGYVSTTETAPGVYQEEPVERMYYGEVKRHNRRLESSGNLNDNINIANEISIIADPYANDHIFDMRYVVFQGAKWKITNVDVQPPRLVLTLGGLYSNA